MFSSFFLFPFFSGSCCCCCCTPNWWITTIWRISCWKSFHKIYIIDIFSFIFFCYILLRFNKNKFLLNGLRMENLYSLIPTKTHLIKMNKKKNKKKNYDRKKRKKNWKRKNLNSNSDNHIILRMYFRILFLYFHFTKDPKECFFFLPIWVRKPLQSVIFCYHIFSVNMLSVLPHTYTIIYSILIPQHHAT